MLGYFRRTIARKLADRVGQGVALEASVVMVVTYAAEERAEEKSVVYVQIEVRG